MAVEKLDQNVKRHAKSIGTTPAIMGSARAGIVVATTAAHGTALYPDQLIQQHCQRTQLVVRPFHREWGCQH